jgi:threonine dehydrogenase-like Zn-dependent dehydrogenase
MMQAVVWHGGADLRLETVADPVPEIDQVLFDVALAGICGSDLHAIRGHAGPRRPPLILGHELVGTVPGRDGRYVAFPLVTCGVCAACLRGEENLCERRGLLGLDRPGAFAERVAVREDALVRLPDGLDDRLAVLVEPLATPLSALRIEDVPAGGRIAVVGCGTIGLLAIYAASQRGLEVVAVEPLASRRALAIELGAAEAHADLHAIEGAGVDAVIDAAGLEATVRGGVRAVRRGAAVVVLGLAQEYGELPIADLVRNGIRIRGHYAYTRSDFEAAAALLAAEPLDLDWLTVIGLDETGDGVRRLIEQPDATTKVLLRTGA